MRVGEGRRRYFLRGDIIREQWRSGQQVIGDVTGRRGVEQGAAWPELTAVTRA